jgi:uncharacterized protein DUF6475
VQAHDRQQFALLVDALAANFGRDADAALLEGYWRALRDVPIEAVEKAVDAALAQCKHMPRGVELRELAGEMPVSTRAVQAWEAVRRAIAKHGVYRSVNFDDPVINATLRNLGGWQKLCATESEEAEKWLRKDFERIYSALCASGISAEQAQHLPGAHEQDAIGKGTECKPPELMLTGMPPQREGIVRQLSAPERLVLTGAIGGKPQTLAEIVSIAKEKLG